jgi:phosphatidylinositol glycan class B
MLDPEEERAVAEGAFVRRWACLGLLLIVVAAVRSEGPYRADEHFQTIEFASFKLGRTPAEALPWEFRARLRSWLQPGLYVVLARAAGAVGVSDPFRQALVFRLVSGLLMWAALVALTSSFRILLPGPAQRRWAVRLTWLAFWTPFLAVRTSSESLAASFTALAVLVLARATLGGRRTALLLGAGLLFGLAFEVRFAAGVVPAGLTAWGLATRRLRLRDAGVLGAGVLPIVALAGLVDRWGYGVWTFPPLNYVEVNLWHDVAAERFGSRPWYGYLSMTGSSALAPLLLLTFAGAATAWIRFPGHVLSVSSAPFVLTHVALAHKEMRFLFPVAPLGPALLVLAGSRGDEWLPVVGRRSVRLPLGLLLALNLAGLAASTLVPPRPRTAFQRYVYRTWPDRFAAVQLSPDSPWSSSGGLEMHFYRPREVVLHRVPSLDKAEPKRRSFLVVASAWEEPSASGFACEPLYRPFPQWVRSLEAWSPSLRVEGHSLHRCRRTGFHSSIPPARQPSDPRRAHPRRRWITTPSTTPAIS